MDRTVKGIAVQSVEYGVIVASGDQIHEFRRKCDLGHDNLLAIVGYDALGERYEIMPSTAEIQRLNPVTHADYVFTHS